jgi:hypothetical protein
LVGVKNGENDEGRRSMAGGPVMPSATRRHSRRSPRPSMAGTICSRPSANRCDRVSLVPLRALKQPPDTPVWKLERALYCEPYSEWRHYSRRQRAAILGLTYARPDPDSRQAAKSPRKGFDVKRGFGIVRSLGAPAISSPSSA